MSSRSIVASVGDQVLQQLRRELLAGAHEPGRTLREEELARRFQVSRHPIRKALQQLTQEGLLDARRNCGVRVAPVRTAHLCGLLNPLRQQLEVYALQQALAGWNERRAQTFRTVLDDLSDACAAQDRLAALEQDFAFHQEIFYAADLEDLLPIWRSVVGRTRDHHLRSNDELQDLRIVAFLHERLLAVFAAGDAAAACCALHSHIENGEFNARGRADWQRLQAGVKQGA